VLRKLSTFIRWSLVLIGIYIVFQLLSGFYAIVSGGSITDLIWVFAGDLHQDREDRTNFLLLGMGGEEHDGGELTDTILIASYHYEFNTLSMLSIPRDFWVEAENGVGMRINKIYEYEKERLGDSEAALENISEIASDIASAPIHYYAKIDFAGFTDLIDALDGVKILVEESIDDPYYPCKDLLNFCPFEIAAGVQTMDGETALQFARSRKTTSDFDRAARQQQVIEAIREKAFEKDLLTNPKKLKKIWSIFEDRMETNLRFREMLMLGKIADEFDKKNLSTIVLNDEPTFRGGILYAPNREDYNGAAVLLPNGDDFRKVHEITNILFSHPQAAVENLAIEVLNGSGRTRTAEKAAYALNRYGLNTARINNYPNDTLEETTIYIYDAELATETAKILQGFTSGEIEFGPVELRKRGFDLTLVLGEDWQAID
jgi:polyisoprenyl-teichoic acid--peptidoglycan teichoic acid transferase